ncbi:competence protein CoiA [Streptococcus panodentis]|uniref:Competence protein CoiA n=1 Tax=Streptococcus panodentis TaxID=1581472 RepID=A0ABS5AUE2_9STRE|nr:MULTISPECIES: competence protein CoiA family protein [Streptococcus]KXT82705.1 Competence protein CoiA [Streptococcus sp. DD11]MBP2620183.1 competence protein CoiA [Streptococcus panodentis]
MLLARNERARLVNALEETPKKSENLSCPACAGAVRFKKGKIMRPHFAHVSLRQCQFYSENESAEHLNLKAALFRWGAESQKMQVEAFLPQLQQMADLLVNDQLALEVQCSPLSMERLQERTISYRQHGYQVLWLLGQKLWLRDSLTQLQKNLLCFSQNMGFHLWELDEKERLLRLKYLIHEDLHGKVQHKTRNFPFGQDRLLDILRLPFQKQEMTSFVAQPDPHICTYIRRQLYYQQPRWMRLQAQLYQAGDNLLTKSAEDFYPQVRPVQASSFCQITADLTSYYQQFEDYYANQQTKTLQILYPPAFYEMTRENC